MGRCGAPVVLSLSKVARGAERYYLETVAGGAEDHRGGGLEPEGWWLGQASPSLGLSGPVTATQLGAVMSGADPRSGEVLNGAQGRVRVAGFDLTFAAPKSVSLLFALGDPSTSAEVRAAHEAAAAAAVGYVERRAITARRGGGGHRHNVAVGGVIAAAFLHRTSRAPDPHLHSHVLVANLVRGTDGRWSAFDARGLYAHSRTAGFLYQAHLRHELTRRLGLEWGPVRNGMADVEGVDRSVVLAFSRRRQQIQAHLQRQAVAGPRAAAVAALATRPSKDLDNSFDTLVGGWRLRAEALGLGRPELAATAGRAREVSSSDLAGGSGEWIGGIVGRTGGLTTTASSFTRRDVLRACSAALPHGAEVGTVETLADRVLASDRVVAGPARAGWRHSSSGVPHPAEPRWTTPVVVAEERALVERAASRLPARAGEAEPAAVASALSARPDLSSDQARAVRRLLGSTAGVDLVSGSASKGAFDALDAAREAWESSGLRVIGTAPNERVAAALEAATGIEATPAAALLARTIGPRPARCPALVADVLVVHDAPGLGSFATAELLESAERAQAKVVLVGAARHLGSAEAGAFRRLAGRLGSTSLDAARPAGRQALAQVPGSDLVEVVERGPGGGGVVIGPSGAAVRQRMVADWWEARRAGSAPVMVATTRREVDLLNEAATAKLAASGRAEAERDRVHAVGFKEARRMPAEQALVLGDRARAFRPGVPHSSDRHYVVGGVGRGPMRLVGLRDDTALLAGLDRERRRTDERLESARRAESDAMRRFESLRAGRAWPGRRAAKEEAGAELGYRQGEVRRWEDRISHLGQRRAELEGRPGERTRPLARPALRPPVRREQALVRAAEVSPPSYLLAELGPRPTAPADRASWRRAAAAVEGYRERWGVSDSRSALGEGAFSAAQRIQRTSAALELESVRRGLRPELARERAAHKSAGRALG